MNFHQEPFTIHLKKTDMGHINVIYLCAYESEIQLPKLTGEMEEKLAQI